MLQPLEALNRHKSAEPGGNHPCDIKNIADVQDKIAAELRSAPRGFGESPEDRKMAKAMAAHEAGPGHKTNKYRPLSLAPVLCEGPERMVSEQLRSHLEKDKHNSVKKSSCLTNLLVIPAEVTRRTNEGKTAEVCYLEFGKAFDSVSYFLLDLEL